MKPTTYKKEYCKKAYDFLSAEACRGIAALAAHLNTSERTVFDWRRNNPEFKARIDADVKIAAAMPAGGAGVAAGQGGGKRNRRTTLRRRKNRSRRVRS